MDFLTVALLLAMSLTAAAILAAVLLLGFDVMLLVRRRNTKLWVSIALKVAVLVWASLLLPPGGWLGSQLPYMQPLIWAGAFVIPAAGVFLALDISAWRHSGGTV